MSSRPLYVTPSDKYYIVKPGDTLSLISRQSGVSVANLKLYNDLDSDRIEIGQKIYYAPHHAMKRIYITERDVPPDGKHIVSKGDDLPLIAKMYGLDLLDLVHYNRITSWELTPGDVIYLTEKGLDEEPVAKKEPVKVTTSTKPSGSSSKPKPKSKPVKPKEKQIAPNAPGRLQHLPVETYTITCRFNKKDRHQGIDLAAPLGTPIYAVWDGKVIYSGVQKGYGNLVILEHPDRVMTVYAHNETNIVEAGESVKAGDKIASMGSTGRSSGNHLHFEIRKAGQPLDPEQYLNVQGR
ncbi:MAG: peptidoglycan DD-metalloendopeptidase family protein [Candidatus Stygibacter frigidus]|nr:peptidoglycan DD-metalloendopeptidase family protein [Candidatus Stygibacter frigidus]